MEELSVVTAGGWALPGSRYGASELKAVYQIYFWRGLMVAVAIYALIFGAYYLAQILEVVEPPIIKQRIDKYVEIAPPPSLINVNVPQPVSAKAPVANPTDGRPVPVSDVTANPEQTLPTQAETGQPSSRVGEGTGETEFQGPPDVKIDDGAPPPDWRPVERNPVVVRKVEPKYPELAMRAGLEGTVTVNIWVDKEGKVKKVNLLKSDAEIFNDAAIEAAGQFLFTPAYMNDGPVSVWVAVPFRFKLADRK